MLFHQPLNSSRPVALASSKRLPVFRNSVIGISSPTTTKSTFPSRFTSDQRASVSIPRFSNSGIQVLVTSANLPFSFFKRKDFSGSGYCPMGARPPTNTSTNPSPSKSAPRTTEPFPTAMEELGSNLKLPFPSLKYTRSWYSGAPGTNSALPDNRYKSKSASLSRSTNSTPVSSWVMLCPAGRRFFWVKDPFPFWLYQTGANPEEEPTTKSSLPSPFKSPTASVGPYWESL